MIMFWTFRYQILKAKPGVVAIHLLSSWVVGFEVHPHPLVDFFKAGISQFNYFTVYFSFRDAGWSCLRRCQIKFIFNFIIAFIVVHLNSSSNASPEFYPSCSYCTSLQSHLYHGRSFSHSLSREFTFRNNHTIEYSKISHLKLYSYVLWYWKCLFSASKVRFDDSSSYCFYNFTVVCYRAFRVAGVVHSSYEFVVGRYVCIC